MGASLLFLVAPGPWFLSGRAFCGTTATALLVASLAFWLQAAGRPRWLAAGSVTAALAVLVRPHFLPAVLGAMLVLALRTSARHRRLLVAALVVPLCLGGAALIVSAGGVSPLWSALEGHAQYHFSRLDEAVRGLAGSGLSRALGHPTLTVAWLVLFHIGMIRVYRQGRWKDISPILIGALLPLMVVIYGLSNPAHARYAIPVLALTGGLVALGLERILRKWSWVAIAGSEAKSRRGVVVADRTLHAFFTLRRLERPSATPVLFDHMIELGHVPPPPPEQTVFVFDAGHGEWLRSAENRRRFSCSIPLVRMLAQDRLLDLTVATGARLNKRPRNVDPVSFSDGRSAREPRPTVRWPSSGKAWP